MIKTLFLLIIFTAGASACAAEKEELKPREIVVSPKVLVEESYLRNVLPSSALAYARIPNIWSLPGIPVGNVFDKALGSKNYVDAVASIRDGLSNTVLPELPEEARALGHFFLHHSISPIEAMFVPSSEQTRPIPNILITTKVDFDNEDSVNNIINDLVKKAPQITVENLLKENEVAKLNINNDLMVQIKLDRASSRLYILGGNVLQADSLEKKLDQLKPNISHQMKRHENDIDASGKGFFVWIDPRKMLVLAKIMGQHRRLSKRQRQTEQMAMLELSQIKNIAVGLGTQKGINNLKIILDMPRTGVRSYLPTINDSPKFKLSGNTALVAVLGLPTRQDYISIESAFSMISPPREMEKYFKTKKEFLDKAGFEIEDIFDVLGQDISFVADEAGHYLAVRLKAPEKFDSMLKKLVEKYKLKYEARTISDQKYHHLSIPAVDTGLIQELERQQKRKNRRYERSDEEFIKLLKRIMTVPSHFYWQKEGEYLLIASVPQVLMDRHYIKSHIAADDWLKKEQRMSPDGALLMASIRTKGVPASVYRARLAILRFLGDVVNQPVDLFSLPSAREAQLPENGAYGIKLSSNESQLALEISFESNPLEIVMAGKPFIGIAIAGFMSQYLLAPAYYDFSKRPHRKRRDIITRADKPVVAETIESSQSTSIKLVHSDVKAVWKKIFRKKAKRYRAAKLVLYRGSKRRGFNYCGMKSTIGSFYCPSNQKVYIDLDFFKDLHKKHGASGDLAQAYVIAHLIGHHVQNLNGIYNKVQRNRKRLSDSKGNKLQVKLELQADCYAGVWAFHQKKRFKSLQKGDLQEALSAVASIGDDHLQKKKKGSVIPDTFTHGTMKQRVKWFSIGAKKGHIKDCDTFGQKTK